MIAIGAKGELCFSTLQMPPEHAGATKAPGIVPGTSKTATGKHRANQKTTTEDQKPKMSKKSKSPETHAFKKPRLEDNLTSSVVRDRMQPVQFEPLKKLSPSENKKHEKIIKNAPYFPKAKIKPDTSSVMRDRMQPVQCKSSRKSPRSQDKKHEKVIKDAPYFQKAMPKMKPDTSSVARDRMQPTQYEPTRKSPRSEDKKHEKVDKDAPYFQKAMPVIKTSRTKKHSSSEALPYKRARTGKEPDMVDIKYANMKFPESNCSKRITKVEAPRDEYYMRVVKSSRLNQVQLKTQSRVKVLNEVKSDPKSKVEPDVGDLSRISYMEWYRRKRLFKKVVLLRISSVVL